jgi:predicted transcriptional regulator
MTNFREIMGDTGRTRVLEFLVSTTKFHMISDVAKLADMAPSSASRVLQGLITSGIVKETKIGREIRMIELNRDNKAARELEGFIKKINGD